MSNTFKIFMLFLLGIFVFGCESNTSKNPGEEDPKVEVKSGLVSPEIDINFNCKQFPSNGCITVNSGDYENLFIGFPVKNTTQDDLKITDLKISLLINGTDGDNEVVLLTDSCPLTLIDKALEPMEEICILYTYCLEAEDLINSVTNVLFEFTYHNMPGDSLTIDVCN